MYEETKQTLLSGNEKSWFFICAAKMHALVIFFEKKCCYNICIPLITGNLFELILRTKMKNSASEILTRGKTKAYQAMKTINVQN